MAPNDNSATHAAESLAEALARFKGKACWSVKGGGAAGSNMLLEFGERLARKTPVRNTRLIEEERTFEGACDLFIQCAWRVEDHNGVVTGSGDVSSADGAMVTGVRRLVGQTLMGAEIRRGVPDLRLAFSGGLVLCVFCDHAGSASDWDNYSLRIGDRYVVVNAAGGVVFDARVAG